ncbi:epoxide hydrolase 2-like [Bidens hawaiensis]|uniref:epoxide hydrolase 2-like n=1 Tax=Bidens hawaiensis TaxID=980011 RepID=UPI00404A877F
MDQIKHSYIEVNGLKLHVAEIGSESSPAVVFLHGFPELWYTWRHQMIAVANAGFRAIAPDYRGYGLSDVPPQPEKATFRDLINDTASILDSLAVTKAYVIGKDFGSMVGYLFALFHPQKVTAIITISMPFMPYGSHHGYLALPEGFYFRRFRELGRAEADFARFDAKTVVKRIYIMFSKSEIPIAGESQEIMDLVDQSEPLPSWFTEEDLKVYGEAYNKTGFQTALQVPYRKADDPNGYPQQGDVKVEHPALFIIPGEDYLIKFPGMGEYVKSGEIKKFAPNLEVEILPQGGHFVHEQFPDKVNKLILDFINRNKF